MEISNSVQSIYEVQRQYPEVCSINYNGISWWPLMRYNELERFKQNLYDQPLEPRRHSIEYKGPINYLRKLNLRVKLSQGLKSIESKNGVALLSFGTSYYSEQIDGMKYNRHIDPFIERASLEMNKIHFDTDSGIKKIYPANYLDKNIFKALAGHLYRPILINIPRSIETKLESSGLSSIVQRANQDFAVLIAEVQVASMILEYLSITKLFVVCFYDLNVWPFVIAANRLGIPVIDIQHGKQGEYHHMYSHNIGIQKMRNMYPSHFWNWGESSAQSIEKWFGEQHASPKCIRGGNLFTQKWLHDDFYQPNAAELAFQDLKNRYKYTVLHCIDRLEEVNNDLYKKTLSENQDVRFAIRLHPAKRGLTSEVAKILDGYDNIDIITSTMAPLYWILKEVDVLLTAWSSVCVEALEFNLCTILTHENARNLYRNYIEQGYFDVNIGLNNFRERMENLISRGQLLKSDFIITDETITNQALSKLLNE